jgi:hypothetical protein
VFFSVVSCETVSLSAVRSPASRTLSFVTVSIFELSATMRVPCSSMIACISERCRSAASRRSAIVFSYSATCWVSWSSRFASVAARERRDATRASLESSLATSSRTRAETASRSASVRARSDSPSFAVTVRPFGGFFSLAISLLRSFTNCVEDMTSFSISSLMRTRESLRRESA